MSGAHGNLFAPLAAPGPQEQMTTLCRRAGARIEQIVSHGQHSPEGFWYDQAEDEWVCLLSGEAVLGFADGTRQRLGAGDWLLIPAHCRHRVLATSSPAVWLAVFFGAEVPDCAT